MFRIAFLALFLFGTVICVLLEGATALWYLVEVVGHLSQMEFQKAFYFGVAVSMMAMFSCLFCMFALVVWRELRCSNIPIVGIARID